MIYLPEENIHQIGTFFHTNKKNKLIVCLCADWCNNCNEWKDGFTSLSEQYPDDFFIWLDIEQYPDMVSSIDLDILPVLLVQKNNDILFLGAIQPRVDAVIPLLNTESAVMRTYDPGIRQFLQEDYNNLLITS
ncbi:hypothetical protein NFT50_004404 [Salmonella enterica]|nr:hypothetical protein [Salmonella enterica]EJH7441138.1 hypothetical protein [Salmonella enterica]EJH7880507.1 hypothetical protein [Salmonella enterica]EJI6713256.1 hypothetical protein [Salmonella enterica]